ncbi:MAG: nicotinate-nucleotide diphosphorylase (carboxylating) [Desulfobulbaceae bacterium A2]|nr:MAG: nicotinate-nucleotide diphosphorylase (carboxylating) [Desulfobulbaceae bacterium A2]
MTPDPILLDPLLHSFLAEDLGHGDVTSEAIFTDEPGRAVLRAREPLVAAGMAAVAGRIFHLVGPDIVLADALADGQPAAPGDVLLRLAGPARDILRAERVALNLVQRLCGIATLTARYVEAVRPLPVRLCDTRKTTPGLRLLEKYAVRVGGGHNHRFNLADGVLIKDNHIAACGSIRQAVARVRARVPHTLRIEVETDSLVQVEECLACGVEAILLDNMDPLTLRRAVELVAGRALTEASGGVTLATVRAIAETGVNLISVGRLTHSAPAVDIGLDWED